MIGGPGGFLCVVLNTFNPHTLCFLYLFSYSISSFCFLSFSIDSMATALQLPHSDQLPVLSEVAIGLVSQHAHSNSLSHRISIPELDYKDNRYPPLSAAASSTSQSRASVYARANDSNQRDHKRNGSWVEYHEPNNYPVPWSTEKLAEPPMQDPKPVRKSSMKTKTQAQPPDGPLPRSLPPANGTLPVDHYSWEDHLRKLPNGDASSPYPDMGQRMSRLSRDQLRSTSPAAPRAPGAGIGAGPSNSPVSPIVPLSAGPSYNPSMQIPVSSKPRAYAQHPTFINPQAGDKMPRAAYAPPQVPKEEVCVECAMRDQDMADVDVTGVGVWERESDGLYEELVRREAEEEASGIVQPEPSSRPRSKGGKLTEDNLKIWLSIVSCFHCDSPQSLYMFPS